MTAAHSVESHTSAETARSLIPGARHLLGHLLIPVYLALGMALAYLGAFHQVEPHHLPVSIVGSSPQTSVLATTVGDQAGPQLSVSTIASLDQARSKVGTGALAAAFAPSANQPTVIIDSAASPTAAQVAQTVFDKVAEVQGKRLVVQDLQPLPANDALGSNLFFLLVALTVGGYTAAATLGVAGQQPAFRTASGPCWASWWRASSPSSEPSWPARSSARCTVTWSNWDSSPGSTSAAWSCSEAPCTPSSAGSPPRSSSHSS